MLHSGERFPPSGDHSFRLDTPTLGKKYPGFFTKKGKKSRPIPYWVILLVFRGRLKRCLGKGGEVVGPWWKENPPEKAFNPSSLKQSWVRPLSEGVFLLPKPRVLLGIPRAYRRVTRGESWPESASERGKSTRRGGVKEGSNLKLSGEEGLLAPDSAGEGIDKGFAPMPKGDRNKRSALNILSRSEGKEPAKNVVAQKTDKKGGVWKRTAGGQNRSTRERAIREDSIRGYGRRNGPAIS